MNSRSALCALKDLKEKCDSYVREMDSLFEDLEEWKESVEADVRELLKGNLKRPVIAKIPTSCSKSKTHRLYIIKESDGECDDGIVQNVLKDSKNVSVSKSSLTSYAGENYENGSGDIHSHSPYLSTLVSHSSDGVGEQNSNRNNKNSMRNSKGSINRRNVTDQLGNVQPLLSSKEFLYNLDEQSSTRSSRRMLRSMNKVAKTSVDKRNTTENQSQLVDNSISIEHSFSHKSRCTEEKEPLIQKNSGREVFDQQLVQMVSSDGNILMDNAKNINEVVSGTRSSVRILKHLNKTAKVSVNRKTFKNQLEDLDKIISNAGLLSHESECVIRKESFIKCQNSQNTRSTIVLDHLKMNEKEPADKILFVDLPKNAEEVPGTRSSQRLLNDNRNKSETSVNRRITKTLTRTKIVQDPATNEELLHLYENKENGESIKNKSLTTGENNIKVSNDRISTQNEQNSVIGHNVFYGVSADAQDGEILNKNHDQVSQGDASDSFKTCDSRNPFGIEQLNAIGGNTSCRLTAEVNTKFSYPVETNKRSSEEFEKSQSFKRNCLIQENLTQDGLKGGVTAKNTNQVEMRKRNSERLEDSPSEKISCLVQEHKMEDKNCTVNLGNDYVIMQQHATGIVEFECNLNSEYGDTGIKSVEGKLEKCVGFNDYQQIKKQEYCKGIIKKTDPEILKTTKRVTRSKARALNTTGNLRITNLEMKINQDIISNKERARKSVNKAIKTLIFANKKIQGGKENSITSTSKKYFTPLMTSKILSDVSVSSSSLLNSSKITPFTRPISNFGSATQVLKSTQKPNIITNVQTFIKKPTKLIESEEKKLEEIKRRKEKEKDVLRRKEEMLRKRAEEQRKKKEERRLKVIHNREVREKEKQEMQERIGKEKSEKLHTLLQEREVKQKGNVIKKKLETENKAADAKQKIEEAVRVAKPKQEHIPQKAALEDAEKEAKKCLGEEKITGSLCEKMEQKTKEMGLVKQKSILQKNADEHKSTADLNTTWVKPTTSVNMKPVISLETETINNAYFLDDLLSEDSDNEEENNHQKKTARWAKKSRLLLESPWQLLLRSRTNKMFSFNKAIDIFPNKRLMRTSSAKWDTPPRWSVLPKY